MAEDLTLAGCDDEPVTVPDDAVVGVAHPLHLDGATLRAWSGVLSDYELLQPFDQLARGGVRPRPGRARRHGPGPPPRHDRPHRPGPGHEPPGLAAREGDRDRQGRRRVPLRGGRPRSGRPAGRRRGGPRAEVGDGPDPWPRRPARRAGRAPLRRARRHHGLRAAPRPGTPAWLTPRRRPTRYPNHPSRSNHDHDRTPDPPDPGGAGG
ncbi:MAG: hypothetical protein AVDCRST_MAG66-2944 [uncultured Pseudonocardia sp.]|uniref:DUF4132 domain-containing protein n=1 Tax=uncultured Pseudonocardia sp. TaxID=211455 RepID=A0A6J4PTK2_9PSEU|nr:MAG: hypothetical protein AVDCRST_MAG66-2944 [uncultured Pseudonocardia sp.]